MGLPFTRIRGGGGDELPISATFRNWEGEFRREMIWGRIKVVWDRGRRRGREGTISIFLGLLLVRVLEVRFNAERGGKIRVGIGIGRTYLE